MSRFTRSLDSADLDDVERAAVEIMVALFVSIESRGGCFDVLVREAIERAERAS